MQEATVMVNNHEDLRRDLAERNPEFRKLQDEHATYENRLEELQGKAVLEDAERLETVNLKKQKLQLKDRMERMLREHIDRMSGSGVRH
ncbi:MAG TPA: YdcH family protein [Dongiaceae bacterium]|nr:YdcH family protein [Dongiaceae bacterium]